MCVCDRGTEQNADKQEVNLLRVSHLCNLNVCSKVIVNRFVCATVCHPVAKESFVIPPVNFLCDPPVFSWDSFSTLMLLLS